MTSASNLVQISPDPLDNSDLLKINGGWGIPFFGYTKQVLSKGLAAVVSQRVQTLGNIYRFGIFGLKYVVIGDPDVLKFMLRHENKLVVATWPKSFADYMGSRSVFMVANDDHRALRHMLAPSFGPSKLPQFVIGVKESVDLTFKKWEQNNYVIDNIYPELRGFTLEVAVRALFGGIIPQKDFADIKHHYERFSKGILSFPINLPFTNYSRGFASRTWLKEYFGKVIEEMKNDTNFEKTECIIQSMVDSFNSETGERLEQKDLVDNTLAILFANHDTSASTLTNLLLILTARNDVWERLKDEQRDVVQTHGDTYTVDIVKSHMPYLDAVIYAFFQTFPTVAGVYRKAKEDLIIPGYDVKIPKDTMIGCSFLINSYQPNIKILGDNYTTRVHDVFNPEFHFERVKNGESDKKAWFGFGHGKRACLGRPLAEIMLRVFMAEIVRKCKSIEAVRGNPLARPNPIPMPHPMKKIGLKMNIES